jgi:redox-sensitive bicupin YhaK (pirin superfamily)
MLPSSKGGIIHKDFLGHVGTLNAGDVQWMTAGRGIVHSEMPTSDVEDSVGLQLWVNLPSSERLCKPNYQEVASADMPKVSHDGVSATIIAGEALGVQAKITPKTPIHYIHYTLQPNAEIHHPIGREWNAFVFTIKGDGYLAGDQETLYKDSHTITFDREGDVISIKAGDKGFDFVLVAGKPIGEPIVQYGPFVMNSVAEIQTAFTDYKNGTNGFEAARSWERE